MFIINEQKEQNKTAKIMRHVERAKLTEVKEEKSEYVWQKVN